jgi:hypothetical protein
MEPAAKMRKLTQVLALAIAVLAVSVWGAPARAELDTHGRFAIGHINIDDASPAGDFSASTFYYRYIANGLLNNDNLSFNLDGSSRYSNMDYNAGIPANRLYMANVKSKKVAGFLDITAGRSFVEEFVSESVDGVDLKMWLNAHAGFGLFGGARPDPYTDKFNADFNAIGAYTFARTDEIGASAGYALDTYKGKKDRERLNAVLFVMPSMEDLHLQASLDMDNFNEETTSSNVSKKGWDITNLLVHANWRPAKGFALSGTYTEFRAINREASHLEQRVEMLEEKYDVSRARAEGAIWNTISIYGGMDLRNRHTDSKSASQTYVGIRDINFYGETFWDIKYADFGYFTATVKAITATFGGSVFGLNTSFSATQMMNTQDGQMGDMEQWVYEVNLDYWFTKNLYATFMFQYSNEKYLDINSIYTTRYADNYNTTTLGGQFGYRF